MIICWVCDQLKKTKSMKYSLKQSCCLSISADAKEWLAYNKGNLNENANVVDDVKPKDSISNVSVHSSHRSRMSSTTSSATIQAKAEKAAPNAQAAALKERHALGEQEQQLRRKREQLEVEAESAASVEKLAVLLQEPPMP